MRGKNVIDYALLLISMFLNLNKVLTNWQLNLMLNCNLTSRKFMIFDFYYIY